MEHFFLYIRIFFSYAKYSYVALFRLLTPGAYIALKIIVPLTQVLFFSLMGSWAGGNPAYYVIGNSAQLAVTSGISGMIQVSIMERRMGTLPQLIMAPASNVITFYGRGLFLIFDGLTSVAAGFFVGGALFGLNFAGINWPLLALAFLVVSFAVSGLGLVLGVMGLVGTDLNYLLNFALALLLVVCGVNFPIASLPQPVQWMTSFLPLTHGLVAVRAIIAGNMQYVWGNLGWEFAIGCVYMLLGYYVFMFIERLARSRSTLELQ